MAGGLLAAPLAAEEQPAGKVYRIGYLSPGPGIQATDEAFRQALRELGYVEGQNLVIEWRFAKGDTALFPSLVAELVRLKVDCLLTLGVHATRVAKQATATIPIVMGAADDDPVRLGLIASFARPGGNITGIVNVGHEERCVVLPSHPFTEESDRPPEAADAAFWTTAPPWHP